MINRDHHNTQDSNEDEPAMFSSLEQSLRDSAKRLSGQPGSLSIASLAVEYRRRRQARKLRRASLCGIASFAILFTWLGIGGWRKPREPLPQPAVANFELPEQETGELPAPFLAKSENETEISQVALQKSHDNNRGLSTDDASLAPPIHPVPSQDQSAISATSQRPIPVLLKYEQGDGQTVFTPGLIIPEHTVRLDWSKLSPEERQTIRQVLHLDPDNSLPDRPSI